MATGRVKSYVSIQNTLIPINTPADTPQSVGVDLGWCILNNIYLRIPPGPQALTGWALEVGGSRVIPWQQPGGWLIGDNEVWQEKLDLEVDTGMTILTYNADDTYTHTMYARLTYTPIVLAGSVPQPQTPLAIA